MSFNGLKFQLLMLSHMELDFEDQKVMPMSHMHCTRKLKPYVFANLFSTFFYSFFPYIFLNQENMEVEENRTLIVMKGPYCAIENKHLKYFDLFCLHF